MFGEGCLDHSPRTGMFGMGAPLGDGPRATATYMDRKEEMDAEEIDAHTHSPRDGMSGMGAPPGDGRGTAATCLDWREEADAEEIDAHTHSPREGMPGMGAPPGDGTMVAATYMDRREETDVEEIDTHTHSPREGMFGMGAPGGAEWRRARRAWRSRGLVIVGRWWRAARRAWRARRSMRLEAAGTPMRGGRIGAAWGIGGARGLQLGSTPGWWLAPMRSRRRPKPRKHICTCMPCLRCPVNDLSCSMLHCVAWCLSSVLGWRTVSEGWTPSSGWRQDGAL